MKVCVIYERSSTGWSAYPPGLPGVAAAGDTVDDVRTNIKGAIALHIAGMTQDELAERDTPGDFAELLDVGPGVPEAAHVEILRRNGVSV